ncbi:hypothetical protein LTR08_008541 [Meristemomyces frigidus]|nr:hypothetical protein LTR08_008541 [Meristemomyces frigidus]
MANDRLAEEHQSPTKSTAQDQAIAARDKAVAAVFGVVELLECILECLDATALLRVQVVSRTWQDLVKCMVRTNAVVRKKFFMGSASLGEVLDGSLELDDRSSFYMRYTEPWLGRPGLEPKAAMLNPWLLPDCLIKQDERCMIMLRGSDLIASMNARDLRNDMLLTQPPTSRITWQILLGEKTTECETTLTEHKSGQHLYIATRGNQKSDGTVQGLADLLKFVDSKVMQHWGCLVDWQASHVHLGGDIVARQEMKDELSGMVEMNEHMWQVLETRPYIPAPRHWTESSDS